MSYLNGNRNKLLSSQLLERENTKIYRKRCRSQADHLSTSFQLFATMYMYRRVVHELFKELRAFRTLKLRNSRMTRVKTFYNKKVLIRFNN